MKNELVKRALGAASAALILGSLTVAGIETASATETTETAATGEAVAQAPVLPAEEVADSQTSEAPAAADTVTQPPVLPPVDTGAPSGGSDRTGTDEAGSTEGADTPAPDDTTDDADGATGDTDGATDDADDTTGDAGGATDDTDGVTGDADDTTGDADGATGEAEKPDGSDDSDDTDDTGTPDDATGEAEKTDSSDDADNTDTPGEEISGGQGAPSGSSQPALIRDNSRDARYEERSYNPSEAFLERGEKIKYSTDMPLDNIPAFITSEMIIGALKAQDTYGYPASVTIAQIIQESGFGSYGPYGDEGQGLSYLAYQYNNLFGIKGTGPAGSVSMRTGEETSSGERYTIQAGFRVYHTYTEAIEDRAKLLKNSYSDLIDGVNDANTFAIRIGRRWATDIDYAYSLIQQMETYDLYRLDRMTLGEFSELLGGFADPCPGSSITSRFGWREFTNSYHKGIDLGTGTQNIPTYAVAAGTVITAGWNDSAGWWIAIDHGDGLVTKYMHHKELYVEVGDQVEKGQQIGLSGTTGNSTGNHLHFQMEINGAAVDPEPYLFPEGEED